MKRPLPPPPPDTWAPASENDSRGPGAYCPQCNTWNPPRKACRNCGTKRG